MVPSLKGLSITINQDQVNFHTRGTNKGRKTDIINDTSLTKLNQKQYVLSRVNLWAAHDNK